jgi:farnesyl-diphosphate farnesyltransferase
MAHVPDQPLRQTLKGVSRSFHLTLRVLPAAVRRQIGLAYLLARTTDTIADTELVPLDQRVKALHDLRQRVVGASSQPLNLGELARQQGSPAERALLENCNANLALLRTLSPADLQLVQEVLGTITSGQELDLRRFSGGSVEQITALSSDTELDDYTYRVAGCVGEFWTRICRAHLFPTIAVDATELLGNGIRFGKGLQLVNILRDLPRDLRQGRCYLPRERLAELMLTPSDLLKSDSEPRLRPLYDSYLDLAQGHLTAGWIYTNALPRGCIRLRLGCAWPILIGFETLKLLRVGAILDPQKRAKVSRPKVRQLVLRSLIRYPSATAWNNLVMMPSKQ